MTADTGNPTFQSTTSSSTIDYIYTTPDLHVSLINSTVDFVSQEWTDHLLLTAKFKFTSHIHGKGVQRINPHLAQSPFFALSLNKALDKLLALHLENASSSQLIWEAIKSKVRQVAFRCSRCRRTMSA
ncbi:hypothetical protein RMATCC62417_18098 [Rhizopus microsporus]|nr:hypothetical protein RMATCC62417_18098 [Rhizopus microsporus]